MDARAVRFTGLQIENLAWQCEHQIHLNLNAVYAFRKPLRRKNGHLTSINRLINANRIAYHAKKLQLQQIIASCMCDIRCTE